MAENNYGLSKKTNVAIAAIAGLGIAKDSLCAVVAIAFIAFVSLTYQWLIDSK